MAGLLKVVLEDKNRTDLSLNTRIERLLIGGGLGLVGGMIPDILEPADHPHHRQTAHSVAFVVLLYILIMQTKKKYPSASIFLDSLLVGYVSHLGLDSTTPMGIPLI
ncbi:metal-dependent hydrolase [Leptospira noguchii]|uniref:Metal-dependent hydrolase n=1 Tax=Leptospira noguchii TaxID=28182 RepID=A0AAE9GH94_9LEPT|nr:metal-dependent hydrolase [Leptospira noguchii]UOG31801.1 metal-dependent hydrolase [Leptospira noguchii]UOG57912.1 metal-dependent hydrolase [Leptospira noguchii]